MDRREHVGPEAPGPPAASPHTRPRVLIVDDEPDILESLRDIVEVTNPGVEVVAARSALDALGLLRASRFDLVLTDYKMPRMNGLEFLAQLRRESNVPAVLMTAFPGLDIAMQAINEGRVSFFLTKPFAVGQVLEVVRSLLPPQPAPAARPPAAARS